ncbi:MAG: four helix bundle suffix domain-containing protein [Syntrophobacteraceae bacterium]
MNHNDNTGGPKIIPPHGGYQDLKSYQMAEIVHDASVVFCDRFIDRRSRTNDQMVQAARSGKQNIAEGSMASGTSKKTELKLVGVARASLEELLLDYQDYLRQHGLPLWGKDHTQAKQVRGLCYKSDRSYLTSDQVRGRLYKPHIESPASAETAANTMVCIIHQANYLLDQQLRALEQEFLKEGGFTEKLYHARQQMRNSGRKP